MPPLLLLPLATPEVNEKEGAMVVFFVVVVVKVEVEVGAAGLLAGDDDEEEGEAEGAGEGLLGGRGEGRGEGEIGGGGDCRANAAAMPPVGMLDEPPTWRWEEGEGAPSFWPWPSPEAGDGEPEPKAAPVAEPAPEPETSATGRSELVGVAGSPRVGRGGAGPRAELPEALEGEVGAAKIAVEAEAARERDIMVAREGGGLSGEGLATELRLEPALRLIMLLPAPMAVEAEVQRPAGLVCARLQGSAEVGRGLERGWGRYEPTMGAGRRCLSMPAALSPR